MSAAPAYLVDRLDDGTPLYKDASSKAFEQWLNGVQSARECTELRRKILEHPTLTSERKAFYGRCLYITARFSLGLIFHKETGVYAEPAA